MEYYLPKKDDSILQSVEQTQKQKQNILSLTLKDWHTTSLTGMVLWAGSSHKAERHQFSSRSGYMPGLRARSPVGGLQKATNECFPPSLFPSLPLSLKINKIFKKRRLTKIMCVCLRSKKLYHFLRWFPALSQMNSLLSHVTVSVTLKRCPIDFLNLSLTQYLWQLFSQHLALTSVHFLLIFLSRIPNLQKEESGGWGFLITLFLSGVVRSFQTNKDVSGTEDQERRSNRMKTLRKTSWFGRKWRKGCMKDLNKLKKKKKKKKPRHIYQDFKLGKKIVYLLKFHFQLCNLTPSLEGSDTNGSQIDTTGFCKLSNFSFYSHSV